MSSTNTAAKWVARPATFLALTALLVVQHAGRVQAVATPSQPLPDPHSYAVTGNYAVASVDLPAQSAQGTVTATLHMSTCPKAPTPANPAANCVPANADIVAAYLYFEMIDVDPLATNVKFNNSPVIQPGFSSVLKRSDQTLTGSACFSSQGQVTLTMFRADVRRLLPIQYDAQNPPQPTGKRIVGDADLVANGYPAGLTVQTMEGGTGNVLPQVAGFSLFVVYRDPTQPLRKIVVYENPKNDHGSPGHVYIVPDLNTAMVETFGGIYKSAADTSALVTLTAATGQKNTHDRIRFQGNPNATPTFLANDGDDPFKEGQTASDRAWASVTYNVSTAGTGGTSLMTPGVYTNSGPFSGFGETPVVTFDHLPSTGAYDCPTFSFAALSTAVADVDNDGLPDGAEDANALYDADGTPLKYNTWGASSSHKDIFIEWDAMAAAAGTQYGSTAAPYSLLTSTVTASTATDAAGHNHMLQPGAAKIFIDAYLFAPNYSNSPVPNPGPITPHLDVGNPASYISAINAMAADPNSPYFKPGNPLDYTQYFIPATDARGGDLVPETQCGLNGPPCQFPDYPGTTNFISGLPLYSSLHFDWDRSNFFHYFFSVHALANAKSLYPCVNNQTNPPTLQNYNGTAAPAPPDPYDSSKSCTNPAVDNKAFHVPRTIGGKSQHPGRKAIIALGGWQKVTAGGNVVEQAAPDTYGAVALHEVGHNGDLWHGGAPATWNPQTRLITYAANCKPTHIGVMNYMFQVTGAKKDNDSRTYFDYSRDPAPLLAANTLDENQLTDVAFNPSLSYRTAWYAPPVFQGATVAKRYCPGAPFADPNNPPSMARLNGPLTTDPNDYDADNVHPEPAYSQDLNFDGPGGATVLTGFNDWLQLALNQLGGTKDPRGFSDATTESETTESETTESESTESETTESETTESESKEFDADFFISTGFAAPTGVTACVIGYDTGCQPTANPSTANYHHNSITWTAPSGPVNPTSFTVFRSTGATFNDAPGGHVTVGTTTAPNQNSLPLTSLIDAEELPDGVQFTYAVKATFGNAGTGPRSDTTCGPQQSCPWIVTARNFAPVRPAAGPPPAFDYVTDKAFTAPSTGFPKPFQAATDVDTADFGPTTATLANKLRGPKPQNPQTPQNPIVTPPAHGTLTNLTFDSNGMWTGGFTYTPASGYSGPDSFTFLFNDGLWKNAPPTSNGDNSTVLSPNATGAVSINVKPKNK